MSITQYFDLGQFAERIAQVATGDLTEDELKADFPEIEYYKIGDTVDRKQIVQIDKFMLRDCTLYEVAQTNTGLAIVKIAQFGEAPTPEEEIHLLTAKRNALSARLAEYQVPGIALIDPNTFEPFDEDTEEGREEKNEYLASITNEIRALDTKISAARALIK